jgi:hypothetical protein
MDLVMGMIRIIGISIAIVFIYLFFVLYWNDIKAFFHIRTRKINGPKRSGQYRNT